MDASTGRPAQRNRTRASLLDAAARLIAAGHTPTTTEVADAAGVSRRTAYRYFPTQDQLLVEAALERLRPQVEAAIHEAQSAPTIGAAGRGRDDLALAIARIEATARVMTRLALENEHLLRTIQRLTLAGETAVGVRPRGSRRIDWLTSAVEPIRDRLGPARFAHLVSALATCIGFDSLFVLRDVRGLAVEEAERVTLWMARSVVQAAVAEADAVPVSTETEGRIA